MTGRQISERGWRPRPAAAWAVRVIVFAAPFIAGWLAIRSAQSSFVELDGVPRLLSWIVQAMVISIVTSYATGRALHRFTPLPALLNMTLVFPDHAPSRFSLALRAGTTRRLLEADDLRLSSDLQQAAEQAIVLVDQLSKHERLTRGHTERVRAHADLLGQQLGLDDEDLNRLRWGALLHDVGKLKVPAEILSKPGAPTDEEWAVLRTHAGHATSMLKPFEPWLGEWLLAASQHHERWDGTGYPLGLKNTEISLAGRIVAVADAYDVITSRRSYKDPLEAEEARRELVASAGTHFDPAVVRAMLEVGLTKPRRANPFGWLLETPGVARAIEIGVATPLAAAAAVVVAITAVNPVPAPVDLALVAPDTTAAPTSTVTTTTAPPTSTAPTESSFDPVTTAPTTTTTTPTTAPTTTPTTARATTSTTVPPTTVPPTTAPTTAAPTTTTTPPTDCELAVSGQTDLPNADLVGCDLSGLVIDGLNFNGANLRNANFTNITVVNFTMADADLLGAILTGANFTDGSFAGSTMTDVGAAGLSLTRVNLDNVSWSGADLADASLSEVSFLFADFSRGTFDRAAIDRSQLSDAQLVDASFVSATMSLVGFDRSNLTRTNFTGAAFDSMTAVDAIHSQTVCPNGTVTDVTCF